MVVDVSFRTSVSQLLYTKTSKQNNWSEEKWDQVINEFKTSKNIKERLAILQEVNLSVVYDSSSIIPIRHRSYFAAGRDGWELNASEMFSFTPLYNVVNEGS